MTLIFDLKLWPKYIKNPSLLTCRPQRWKSRVAIPYSWGREFSGNMASEVKGQGHVQNDRSTLKIP